MIHSKSSCSKENITIDDVCTFYVKYMWQLIGGCLNPGLWLVQILCKLKLSEEQQTIFSPFLFHFLKCFFLYAIYHERLKRLLCFKQGTLSETLLMWPCNQWYVFHWCIVRMMKTTHYKLKSSYVESEFGLWCQRLCTKLIFKTLVPLSLSV